MRNITLSDNQSLYLGEDIKVTIKNIYRKKNGRRFVNLFVQAPNDRVIFKDEKVALNAPTANDETHPSPKNNGNPVSFYAFPFDGNDFDGEEHV